ncbi:MAG: hypothetical protein ACREUT_14700 [Steroidobacteraceae bacterium]
MRTIFNAAAATAAAWLLAFPAFAQTPPGVARGTIEALNGDTLTLETEHGNLSSSGIAIGEHGAKPPM